MAEGLWGRSREGQVPAILEAFRIPYTGSDALAASLCLDKAFAKRLWQQEGLRTAPFAVMEAVEDAAQVVERIGSFPMFLKPLQEGSSKGVDSRSIVDTREQLEARAGELFRLYKQPVLVEAYLPGREFTVGVLGGGARARVLGMAEVNSTSPGGVSGFYDKEQWESKTTSYYTPVEDAELSQALADLALRAYRSLGCADIGRVDIRCDSNGEPHLLEINPVPAMHPTHSAMTTIGRFVGVNYEALLAEVIDHARHRWNV
jgi:D-alanine-D-alanine ligase